MQSAMLLVWLSAIQLVSGALMTFDSSLAKNRPVAAVVKMLKDMQATLEDEKKKDAKMYKDLDCWCKENKKAKAGATADAQAQIKDLANKIAEMKAAIFNLDTETANLKSEVKEAEKTMDAARILNGRQQETLHEEAKEIQDDKSSVQKAQTIISTPKASLLQTDAESLKSLASELQSMLERRAELFDNSLTYDDHDKLNDFIARLTRADTAFLQGDPSGGELTGMFNSMKDDLDKSLKRALKEAKDQQNSFDQLIYVKKAQIQAAEQQIEKKREEKATTKTKMFQAEVEIKDKKKNIGADAAFVKTMTEKCAQNDGEYAERVKTREEEIEAVTKALEVLDSDEALATFGKALGFLQVSAEEGRRQRAVEILSKAASKDGRLLMLAMLTKKDKFEKVKMAIDDMLKALKQEMQDDVKQKQFCVDAFNQNNADTIAQTAEKDKFVAKLSALTDQLKAISDSISALNGKIADAKKQMDLAAANRKKEAKDFAVTVADQKASQVLLKKALEVLKKFYLKSSLVQVKGHQEEDAQPEMIKTMGSYKKSNSGSKVLDLMQQIIFDTKNLQAETERAEKEAIKSYEYTKKTSQASVDSMTQELNNLMSNKAKTEQDIAATTTAKEGAQAQLADLAKALAGLHETCDFFMKNFDMRKQAREDEMEGLKTAKNVLSGMKFLQKN